MQALAFTAALSFFLRRNRLNRNNNNVARQHGEDCICIRHIPTRRKKILDMALTFE